MRNLLNLKHFCLLVALIAGSLQGFAQDLKITGKVTDSSGEAIIGASVLVKGTANGTATDLDGNFALSVPANAILEVTSIGYKGIEASVAGKKTFNFVLEEDSTLLDDVVVVGYATMRKKDLTGSVYQVKAGEKDDEAPMTVQDLLRNIPGLNVGISNSAKGGGSIEIRGERSMSSITSTSPMLVVDGMPFYGNIADINPEDIGQIDILKDASAAAVYGSQAANGVIIISTKKGKEGKPSIQFTSKLGLVQITQLAQDFSTEELLDFERDYQKRQTYGFDDNGVYRAYQNGRIGQDGYYDRWTDLPSGVTVDQWRAYSGAEESLSNDEVWFRRIAPSASPELISGFLSGETYDWLGYATRLGVNQDYNLSVSGASDRSNYYMSAGYMHNTGTLLGDEFSTVRSILKLTSKVTKWLELGGNVNFQTRTSDKNTITLSRVMMNNPYTHPFDEDGNPIAHPNGTANSWKGYSFAYDDMYQATEGSTTSLNGIFTAKVTLPFDITYSFNVAPRYNLVTSREFTSSDHIDYTPINSGVDRSWKENFEWSLNNTINWDHIFARKHHVTLTLVQEAERHESWSDNISARNIEPTDALGFHYTAGAGKLESSFSTSDTYQTGTGYLARLFYSFDDRYMITTSVRRDGYSAFGQNVPYATFPSVAVAWTFTNEDFFKWEPMSLGKIRLSWGQNGNRALSNPYLALASLSTGRSPFGYLDKSGSVTEMQYLTMGRMANPDLQWERSESINAALDFGFFRNRISGSIEWYHIKTKDMILNRTLPSFTGFSSIATNIGQVSNCGVEFSLNTRNIDRRNIKWNTSFQLSYNKNTIDHLYYEYTDGVENDDIKNEWFIGQPISVIWDYLVDGVYQVDEAEEAALLGLVPGDIKVRNVYTDDDKILEDGTRVPVYNEKDKTFIGDSKAPVMWSMNNRFTFFKDFDFAFNISSKMGSSFLYTNFIDLAKQEVNVENGCNFIKKKYWTPETPYEDWGRINAELPSGATGAQKLYNGSFIRLENVSLGYNVPRSFTRRFGIQSLKLNATVRNAGVIRFTDWNLGDPQNQGRMNRTYTFGINVTL